MLFVGVDAVWMMKERNNEVTDCVQVVFFVIGHEFEHVQEEPTHLLHKIHKMQVGVA